MLPTFHVTQKGLSLNYGTIEIRALNTDPYYSELKSRLKQVANVPGYEDDKSYDSEDHNNHNKCQIGGHCRAPSLIKAKR